MYLVLYLRYPDAHIRNENGHPPPACPHDDIVHPFFGSLLFSSLSLMQSVQECRDERKEVEGRRREEWFYDRKTAKPTQAIISSTLRTVQYSTTLPPCLLLCTVLVLYDNILRYGWERRMQ